MVDLLIPGPEGKIEAKYTHNNNDQSPIVLICILTHQGEGQ